MPTASIIFILWTLLAGVLIAFQPLVNIQLGNFLNNALWAAFTSFATGATILFILAFTINKGFPHSIEWKNFQWWMILGGFFGAFLVSTSLFLVPKIGLTAFISIIIASQLITATILDHTGFLSQTIHEITWPRLLGIAFLITGAVLTQKI